MRSTCCFSVGGISTWEQGDAIGGKVEETTMGVEPKNGTSASHR